jgi:hypothetical protein
MQLSETAISKIKKNKRIRSLLALALNRTEYTIIRWVNENNDNLTKAVVIQIIQQETGLLEAEILQP